MSETELEAPDAIARPRTAMVLALVMVAAVVFSYLAAYAIPNAAVASDIMRPWPQGHDPRPGWMAKLFVSFVALSAALALIARWLSRRSLRKLDELADATEEFRIT